MSQVNHYPSSFLSQPGAPPLPRLLLPLPAASKLEAYIVCAMSEISGLGTLVYNGADIVVDTLHLLDQICTSSSTDLNPDAVADLMYQFIQSGEDLGKLRLWWHSHYVSPTFWSETDNPTIDRFGASKGWMVSLVGNCAGDRLARLDLFKPFRLTIPLEIQIIIPPDPGLIETVRQEISHKVTLSFPTHWFNLRHAYPPWRKSKKDNDHGY